MTDFTHTDLQLVGRHVPEPGAGPFDNAQQAQAMGYDTLNPVTGMYQIGVVIEGAFVPLISEKASLIFDQIELAKQTQEAQPAQPAQPTEQPQPQAQTPLGAAEQPAVQPVEQPQPTDQSQA